MFESVYKFMVLESLEPVCSKSYTPPRLLEQSPLVTKLHLIYIGNINPISLQFKSDTTSVPRFLNIDTLIFVLFGEHSCF
mgnify:CR=1 FL=1